MNKIISKITAAAMAAALALGLSSCTSDEGGFGKNKKDVIASKEHIYSSQTVEFPGGLDYINTVLYSNGKLFVVGDHSWTEGEEENRQWFNETKMQIMSIDGTLENEVIISTNDGNSSGSRYMNGTLITADGNLAAIESAYSWNEETGESSEDYFLVIYGLDGSKLSEANLEKVVEATGSDWFYVYSFVEDNEGNFLMLYDSVVYAVDKNGNFLYKIASDNGSGDSWMGNMVKAGDGRIFVTRTTGRMEGDKYVSETKLIELDTANKQFGTEYDLNANGTLMAGTDKYDLLITRDSGLAGYDVETGETETIIDWLKSGIDTTAMEGASVMPDGRILCITYNYNYNGGGGYSWSSSDKVINILTELDPSTIPDKKLIKLYALYLNIDIKRQILEFNKNNLEYEIELTSYDEYAVNDYNDAVTKLNNDLIAGNIPDILVLNERMPVDSYIAKGMFANIYDFIDEDNSMSRDDFLTNVFEAYEVDGKLYEVIPTFTINTLVGKTSQVGSEQGWTMDEFMEFINANPDTSVFGSRWDTKSSMLSNFISYNYRSFVDKETGKCSFDSDDFIKLLEFCNKFPKEYNYDDAEYGEDYWNEYEARYRNGTALLNMAYISRFSVLREYELGSFGEPITFKGFPGNEGGSVISSYTSIAITSKANNKYGAWDFVKYFYSEEYQDQYANNNAYNFPIRISSLEKQAESAKERPYWEDENGEKQYYDNNYWIGGEPINLGVNTDEDNARMMEFIRSVHVSGRYDQTVYDIVNEEAAAYFEGQKSAKEVADIIQNRVSVYIAENR